MSNPRSEQNRRAFTLVEVLLASIILSLAVGAITQSISTGHQQSSDALHSLRGVALAEALLEEVLGKPYADPNGTSAAGPESGETTRQMFDNMDDFHGYTEAQGQVMRLSGTVYGPEYASFERSITATYNTVTIADLGGTVSGLTVVVTVTDDKGRLWTVMRFIPEPSS